jgi:hypothetical protein
MLTTELNMNDSSATQEQEMSVRVTTNHIITRRKKKFNINKKENLPTTSSRMPLLEED